MVRSAREASVFPACIRDFEVVEVVDVTPGMRRVVVGGPAMSAHERDGVAIPAVRSHGFDDAVKVVVPDLVAGGHPFDPPRNTGSGVVDWTPGSLDHARTYTVRRFDPDAGELTIDVALHDAGLASTWARRTRIGDRVLICGPWRSAGLPAGVDWMLIGGDETALPAIAHCLEKLPPALPAVVVIEVADPAHRQELRSDAAVEVTWLYRSEAGGRSRLAETVTAAPWRDGRPYLWVAGEMLELKPVRRWAKERQLPREHVEIAGYWRRREVATVAGDPEVVDVAAEGDHPFARIHGHAELLAPFALRAAVTLGVFAAIDAGARTPAAVAAACDAHPDALRRLLRHLTTMALLTHEDDRFSLTEDGEFLADPDGWWPERLRLDGVHAQLDLSFAGLLDAVRTGSAVGVGGTPMHEWLDDADRAARFHDAQATDASFLSPAIVDALSWEAVETVAVVGETGGSYADVVLRERPALHVSVVGLPTLTARMLGDVAAERHDAVRRVDRSPFAPLDRPVDLLLAVDIVDVLPDDDAVVALAAHAASAERVVIVTRLLDPGALEHHDTEDDLRRLCVFGSGRRTEAELRALVARAGGEVTRVGPLGWGAHVVEFRARR